MSYHSGHPVICHKFSDYTKNIQQIFIKEKREGERKRGRKRGREEKEDKARDKNPGDQDLSEFKTQDKRLWKRVSKPQQWLMAYNASSPRQSMIMESQLWPRE